MQRATMGIVLAAALSLRADCAKAVTDMVISSTAARVLLSGATGQVLKLSDPSEGDKVYVSNN